MVRDQFISALLFLLIGVFLAYKGFVYGIDSFKMPGAGMYPFFVGIAIVCLSSILAIKNALGKPKSSTDAYAKEDWILLVLLRPIGAIGVLFYFVFTIETFGFFLSCLSSLFFWSRFIQAQTWRYSFILSIVVTFATYLLFVKLLGILMPEGLVF